MNVQADMPRSVRELRQRTGAPRKIRGQTFPKMNRWENGRAKPLARQKIEELLRNRGKNGARLRLHHSVEKLAARRRLGKVIHNVQ